MTRYLTLLLALCLTLASWGCDPDDDANNGDTSDAATDTVEADTGFDAEDGEEDTTDDTGDDTSGADADDTGDDADAEDTDDASDSDTGLPEDACRSDQDCDNSSEYCLEPGGFAGCGACMTPENTCQNNTDCTGDDVCRPAEAEDCLCDSDVSLCDAPCTSDDDCDAGESCTSSGLCEATSCGGPGSDCPTHFECQISTCDRRACTTADDCPDGVCVNGRCYAELGTCALPVP